MTSSQKLKREGLASKLILNKLSDFFFKMDTVSIIQLSEPGIVTRNKFSIAIKSLKKNYYFLIVII